MLPEDDYDNSLLNRIKLKYIPQEEFITSISLGRGTYGFVKKAEWKGQKVAIKYLFKKDFLKEAEQLSRVKHENIIGVYGYTNIDNDFGLMLEFADSGNLYNFLHDTQLRSIHYTLSHAISWCLQCARGVHYLHSLNILHRDLKPNNLLLTNKCRTVKICDFGTAREKQTIMSNSQGTASWMAPEVFQSRNYSEKCDVYSWGIILWEVLTRKVPYQNMLTNNNNSCAILWATSNGYRPSMIRDCPEIFKTLITNCWAQNVNKRPSMEKVVKIMETIFNLCPNEADQEIELIRPIENFEFKLNAGNAYHDDYTAARLLQPMKPNLCHKRSNSHDAQLILSGQENQNENQVEEDEIQDIIRNFNAYLFLPPQFSPPSPDINNTQSTMIFQEHRRMALKLFRMKFEFEFLVNRVKELEEKKNKPYTMEDSVSHYIHLTNEKRNLQKARSEFAKSIIDFKKDSISTNSNNNIRSDDAWVYVYNHPSHQMQ